MLSTPVEAWHSAGHMITAQIAYDELTDSARREVDRLVAVLVETGLDEAGLVDAGLTGIGPASKTPVRKHAVTASLWADDLKRQDVRVFDHWHYTNLAVKAEGVGEVPAPRASNVVWAIEQAVTTLRGAAGDLSKALMLHFLLHFVGDIHQPMHCATQFTAARPEGDRGGNDFSLDHERSNLHAFWDDVAGLFPVVDEGDWQPLIRQLTDEVKEQVPKASLPHWHESQPSAWARESLQLAIDAAYSDIVEGGKPSPEYVARAQHIARRRVALGGYRLGALLNDIFESRDLQRQGTPATR